jgi:hypothetical protein
VHRGLLRRRLGGAVRQAMALTRRSLQGIRRYYSVVLRLRDVARHLNAEPDAEEKSVLFPGWHQSFEEESDLLIRAATDS